VPQDTPKLLAVVELMESSVNVGSAPAQGTTVKAVLPARQPTADQRVPSFTRAGWVAFL
jgi:hypothetical protein